MTDKASKLLEGFEIEHTLPSFGDYKEVVTGGDGRRLTWEGQSDDYLLEISVFAEPTNSGMKWQGKAYVQSECGVVLDNVATLPRFNTPEEGWAAITIKLDERMTKLQKSNVTGSFPFVSIDKKN